MFQLEFQQPARESGASAGFRRPTSHLVVRDLPLRGGICDRTLSRFSSCAPAPSRTMGLSVVFDIAVRSLFLPPRRGISDKRITHRSIAIDQSLVRFRAFLP